MPISDKVRGFVEQGGWIRRMFEAGINLKAQYGEDKVFDLSLGNPVVEPPQEFHDEAKDIFLDFYRANEPTADESARGMSMESMFGDFAKGRMATMQKIVDGMTKAQANDAQATLGRQGGAASPSNPVKPPMTSEEIVALTWKP